jgi:hypothetical protein
MTELSFKYLSTLNSRLIHPLLTLLNALEVAPHTIPNEVETGGVENGHAAAIVMLAAVLFEATINLTRYQKKELITQKTRHPTDYFAKISLYPELAKDIEEVFAVRDAIAHNHLWDAQVGCDENGTLKFTDTPSLVEGYGDKRRQQVLDPKSRCSWRLKLNLFPQRIGRRDAYVVLKTIVRALKTLEKGWGDEPYEFQGQERTLSEIIAALPCKS